MEPLGVFSSAGTTADLCKKLLLLCKNVKNAKTETDQLRRLLANFQKHLTNIEEMRSSPNNAKLKHIRQLSDAIHETQSLLQKLVDDLPSSSGTSNRILRKIKGSSIRWPFERDDILKRMNSLERCMQVISENLQVDQTNILLDIDYRAILDKLPVANDALFDSFDESGKARCLPETRVDLLRDISSWARDPDSHAVFWLNGMAGTGKSTISRTVSKMFANENRLGASFFFKRGEADRGGLAKFFTTIAADLVRRQPIFAPRIKEAIEAEPSISTKSASDQFKKLIINPLSTIPRDSGQANPIIIVVDALDECDQDKDIELLIWLFSHSSQPAVPMLKFFLTSRPELPPRLGFKKIEGTYEDLVLHEVPAGVIENDIMEFLKHELFNIRNDYNLARPDDFKLPESWPGNHNIEILVKMAVPLFIFASTTCRFIADRKHGDPQRQLQRVLQYETKATGSRLDATYLPILAQQIDGLSSSEKAEVAQEFRAIVGTIIIVANPLSITALSRVLSIPKEIISNRLEMLHSVLSVPLSLTIPVRLLHLSFRDFLLDPEKRDKTPLWVEERQAHAKMTDRCLRLLDNLKPDICDLKSPSISMVDIPRETINQHLPPEVQYCCLYWVNHVRHSEAKLVDGGPVSEFLLRHFLHWLEAMSLIGRTREIIDLINVLQILVEPESGIQTSSFLNDAKLFILTHADTIESWPLQTYSSALVFTPSNSRVRAHFKDSISSWIPFPPLVDYSWDPCKQVLDVPGHTISCIAFSRDSKLLAAGSSDCILSVWDVSTGKCLQKMTGHKYDIKSLQFSHDSSRLMSASSHESVRIWHTQTGDCIRVLCDHRGDVTAAVFSHDSTLIASVSGSVDTIVRIWNVETGECRHDLPGLLGHPLYITSLAFSHNSTLVASASLDGAVRIWRTDSGVCKSILHQNNDPPAYLAMFSPDSTRLAALHEGGTIRFWNVDTESCEREFQLWRLDPFGRSDPVALSHDWKYFLTTEKDVISLRRVDTEQRVKTFNDRIGNVSSLAFSYDSTCFASVSRRGAIGIWDVVETDQKQPVADSMTIAKHDFRVEVVVFSHDSSLIATTSMLGNIIMVWNAMTGCCIQQLKFPGDFTEDIVFSHNCSLVASVSRGPTAEGLVNIWEVDTGLCTVEFSTPARYKTKRTFSSDLEFLATRSGTIISLWHVGKGVCVRTFEYGAGYDPVVFSDDSKFLGAATTGGTISLWQTDTGDSVYQYCIPDSTVIRIAFSHDLTLMAIATISHDIHVISRNNGKFIWTFKAPGPVDLLEFTYDASSISASIGSRGAKLVWRIDNGQFIHKMHYWERNRFWNVYTDTSREFISDKLNNTQHHCCGYKLSPDGRWIIWGKYKLLRLPKKYETQVMVANDSTVVLVYESGRVIILTTSTKDLPEFAHTIKTNMVE